MPIRLIPHKRAGLIIRKNLLVIRSVNQRLISFVIQSRTSRYNNNTSIRKHLYQIFGVGYINPIPPLDFVEAIFTVTLSTILLSSPSSCSLGLYPALAASINYNHISCGLTNALDANLHFACSYLLN